MLITENRSHSPQNGTQKSPIRRKSIFGKSDSNQNGGPQGGNYKRYQSLSDEIDGSRRAEFNRNKSMFDDTLTGTCILSISSNRTTYIIQSKAAIA